MLVALRVTIVSVRSGAELVWQDIALVVVRRERSLVAYNTEQFVVLALDASHGRLCDMFLEHHIHICVVLQDVTNCRLLDPFCPLLLDSTVLDAVHLWAKANKLVHHLTGEFIFHLAQNLLVGDAVQLVVLRIITKVEHACSRLHVRVDVIGVNIVEQRVSVGETQFSSVSILGFDEVVVEVVHERFAEIQDSKPDVDRFIQHNLALEAVYSGQVIVEDMHSMEGRLCSDFLQAFFGVDQLKVHSLSHVFHGFAKDRIVQQLEEILFERVSCLLAFLCVQRDVLRQPERLTEFNTTMDARQLHPELKALLEVDVVYHVLLLLMQIRHQLFVWLAFDVQLGFQLLCVR